MRDAFTTSVRRSCRTWAQVALAASAVLVLGNAPASAQYLYVGDYVVGDISTNNNLVPVKTSYQVQATSGVLTVRWDAWKAGPYNCAVHIYVMDRYGNIVGRAEHQGTPNNETFYSTCFGVSPYQTYTVHMEITDPQTQPRWIFYNYYFEVLNGSYLWGIYVPPGRG